MAWLRLYDELLHDQKLITIADELNMPLMLVRGAWDTILLLGLTSPVRGRLMITASKPLPDRNVNETFHLVSSETAALLDAFTDNEMLHWEDGCRVISNWDKRQFESDLSTDRVKKHRDMKRKGNVSETPPEQNRTEQKQSTEQKGHAAVAATPTPGPKPCSWCKPKPGSETPIQGLMRCYHDQFKQTTGSCPVAFEAKAGEVFRRLLKHAEPDVIVTVIGNLFASTDEWIVEHAYPPTKLQSDFNALRAHPIGNGNKPKPPPKKHYVKGVGYVEVT